jgi:hypothetical protein
MVLQGELDDGGERDAAVSRMDNACWRREDRSKWTPELGRAHASFELGKGWGLEWGVCMWKFFDFESAWGFVEKGRQVGKTHRPQQVADGCRGDESGRCRRL